jgi:hypothetical protein
MAAPRPLGQAQEAVMSMLRHHEHWRDNVPGWTWGGQNRTKRILDSLVRRGVAKVEKDGGTSIYRPASD